MPLQPQPININFSQGLDLKTDPFQVQIGKFLSLKNSIFNKGGLLQKRNGFGSLPKLPDATSNYLTTFNGDLTAIGNTLKAYSPGSQPWISKGSIQPVQMDTLPLIRNNVNQSQADTAIASNGLICTVYTESDGSTTTYKYAVADSVTGQNVVAPTALVGADATLGTPRVFLLGIFFIVVYTRLSGGVYNLRYIAISTNTPSVVTSAVDFATAYTPNPSMAWDGIVYNGNLYLAMNGAATSGINVFSLSSGLVVSSVVIPDATHTATMVRVTSDPSLNLIWVSYYSSSSTNGYVFALDNTMAVILAATQIITSLAIVNLTGSSLDGTLTSFYETTHVYSYGTGAASNFISSITCTYLGVVGSPAVIKRSVGLASKSFMVGSTTYFACSYSSPYQSTYFVSDSSGHIIAKLAYQNGGGYLTHGLPSVTVDGTTAMFPYLIKDLIQAVNKDTNVSAGTQVNGIYSQTGINLASLTLGGDIISTEIGSNLNLTGGFLWAYDGYLPVEQGFFLYPDSVEKTATATTGGSITAQPYFWQVTYEWSDNQGNLFRSAPSIPITFTVPAGTSTNTVSISVPTLRLTYKTANPVKIVIYRWSQGQQTYYQTTSISSPILNDPTVDSITFVDTHSDATILGNNLLYTTGGVVENIGPPSFKSVFLFDNRLWGITSEDRNVLWYSKELDEATPVEMSDLFTFYVAPNIGAQGPSGDLNCGFPMDDKSILFKSSSILYFNGTGPAITGTNSQYSQPILVTSTVGCSNQKSIVFTPQGLMFEFQSESGNQIWLLGRDLSTHYIGAPVQDLTIEDTVLSTVNIPGTNQVRFNMSSGITLMYDYYYQQWGEFTTNAISSTLFQGLHTYIGPTGLVFQETPGTYLDGTTPVLISFQTGWIGLGGLRGYERVYEYSFLGTYYSPHKLVIQTAFDYGSPIQQSTYNPTNYSPAYGGETVYGGGKAYGGPGNIESFKVSTKKQKCKAFQISVQEIYDASYGVMAGQGLSLSGINCVVGVKKGWAPVSGRNSVA